ncbi:MAG: crosslink repair DNA glycosylase YcaQ family protein [Acidimicrobiia bacterium]
MRQLTNDQARRLALAAQGFNDPRPSGRTDVRHFRKVIKHVGMVQLDSVNVFSRTHYMPFFSRLGPYESDALDRHLWGSGELFEYWGHEASLIPVEDHRLWRWLMKRELRWERFTEIRQNDPEYLEDVLEQVRTFGPVKTSDLKDPGDRNGNEMWGWSRGKVALEALFAQGVITTAERPNFTRMYDLTERVIDAEHLGPPELSEAEAIPHLILNAARHMGVATIQDLIDYPRLSMRRNGIKAGRAAIADLAKQGHLEEVVVKGWDRTAYLHPDAKLPKKARGTALLSPFDSLIWFRDRTERLWDFYYRIEIYVPAAKRVHGYYVLPFLLHGDLVARVDLKTDRKSRRLLVKGSFGESGIDRAHVGAELMKELERVASWLGMVEVEVFPNGDLAPFVR